MYVGQSHGNNAYDSCLPKAVSALGCFLGTYIYFMDYRQILLSDHAARQKNSACQYARSLCGGHGRAGAMALARLGARRRETVTLWKSSRPGITWRRRERGGVTAKGNLVPRLHLPNVWEVESLASQDDL